MSLRRVIDDEKNRENIVKSLHDEEDDKRKKKYIEKSQINIDDSSNKNK